MLVLALTGTAKVVLLIVAVAFIVYALVVSMVVPRRYPGFPGRNLGAFVAVTALFFVVQMGTVWWATGQEEEGHGEEAVPTETQPPATAPTETETTPAETEPTPAETEPAETGETGGGETGAAGGGDPAAGEDVFASAGCGTCHTLAAAGASGTIGPSLDDSQPSFELVVDRVTNGQGAMPAFGDQLSEQQIADVAAYVVESAGSS